MTPIVSTARRIAGLFVTVSISLSGVAVGAGMGSYGGNSARTTLGTGQGLGLESSSGGGEALGLGIFSRLPFRITVAVQTGYDDNILTRSSVEQQGSPFTNASIGVDYQFGSPRTQIEARAGGGITYYYDRPQQSGPDYNGFFDLTLTHKFNARLSLAISAYTTYQTEPDFSLDIDLNRRSGNYFYTSDHFKLDYQLTPRFSTGTSYTITTLLFDNTTAGDFQNRIENTFGNEFRYLILPTSSLVGEYRIMLTDYLDADADAQSHFFLVGLDHTFNPRFNATARVGVQLREFESTGTTMQSSEKISPDVESTITYQINERSNVIWTNRYGIQEGDSGTGSTGSTSYRTGLAAKYGITPRIAASFSVYYNHVSFGSGGEGNAFDEDSIDIALTARYAMTRYLGIQAGYNRTDVFSGEAGRGYSRNRIFGGFDFVF
jgi:hypothetical protein